LRGVAAIDAGRHHCVALREDGSVACWGYDAFGQCQAPPSSAPFRAIAAGFHSSLGVQEDGTIVVWGEVDLHAPEVPTGFGATTGSALGDFSVVAASVSERRDR
jgi:alpha-tubulin suppressor-like RCC1 family protein